MSDDEIVRPNGKVYRSRKGLRWVEWAEEDYPPHGFIVFGTHDEDAARKLVANAPLDCDCKMADAAARAGWIRDGYRWGEREWIEDALHGAAAVILTFECLG